MKLSKPIAGTMKWGAWGAQFSTQQYAAMIHECLNAGITTFDHADIYGHYTTEAEFGEALAAEPSLRRQMQIITKCGIKMISPNRPQHHIKSYDTGRAHILQSVENSLQQLHTDHIDILLLHRPDPLMDPDKIAEAFTVLKQSGKVLEFGVSNFTPSQATLIHSRFPIGYNQVEASVLRLDPFTDGTFDHCITNKIIPMAWSPLGGGNIFTGTDEQELRIQAVAGMLGKQYQCGADQVLLAWLMRHPSGILPVLGTAKAERIRQAVAAADIHLSSEEWFMLWRASAGNEVP